MRRLVPVGLCSLFLVSAAQAVITALLPLDALLSTSTYVVVAKVEKFYPEKPAMMLEVVADLKGKAPFKRLPVNLAIDPKASDKTYQSEILKRLGEDLEVVLFINQRGKVLTTFAYTEGTWFNLHGQQTAKDAFAWRFMNGEPFLRRTFKGTTAELKAVLADAVAGKKKPPAPNEKEPNGFGPEFGKKSSSFSPFDLAPRFGEAAPTNPISFALFAPAIGGPLAILAILFPTIFGGVLVLFRQWIAFITLLSLNTTLLLLHFLLGDVFRGSWLADPNVLWFIMAGVNLLCFVWAWRRQVSNVSLGSAAVETPQRAENMALIILSLVFLALTGFTLWATEGKMGDINTQLTLVLTAGVLFATLIKGLKALHRSRSLAVPLSTEGVMIGGVLVASLFFFGGGRVAATIHQGDAESDLDIRLRDKKRWEFPAEGAGVFVSTPLVTHDRVFAASAHPTFKFGTLHCIDRSTGALIWKFDDDGSLKQVYSSPTVADGRLYIGEGFHDDPDCKLYCIDAARGGKIWEFQTRGQTESSPAVALGRVYFGAGNVGFYCLSADAGKEIWSYPPKDYKGRLLRFCGNPAVVQGRVFTGTGVDRNQPKDKGETAVFCFDARSGALIWKKEVDLPVWAAPVVEDQRVYVALGNGDIVADANHYDPLARNKGSVLCLRADTGEQLWRIDVPNGILNEVVLDQERLYFGSRDGMCYALDKTSGKRTWERPLHSAVIAAPALARLGDRTESVIGVSTFGRWASLDPRTGKEQWAYDLAAECHFTASPRVVPTRSGRQIFVAGCMNGDFTRGQPVVFCLEDLVSEK